MASTEASTSSSLISEEHKKTIDEAFLNKMKGLVERLRLENATLTKSLDIERSGVRALKAQHDAAIRNIKTENKKKEEFLEKQLRMSNKAEKPYEDISNANKAVELKKLATEIQALKAANKGLQEKLKVAQSAEIARASELRAQSAKYAALEQAARRDARMQCHKLLEEIKSKERLIIQLQREVAKTASQDLDQTQRMECRAAELSRKQRVDQGKDKTNREGLKTDIQHRKETFYREAPPSDEDSAVSSAPPSLSSQPINDMWSCEQCRSAEDRALAAARECSRLTDALRDARDQLELMEFRLLELEDAAADKGTRDLTDSDSGCVSPGSRIKDSASPELKRMDSGYKSPNVPSSPCNPRRNLTAQSHEQFKEEFAKAQVLADILDRNSETDSLRSNPVKDHLELMILNAASAEDRSCLEQVSMLLYNYQALSSSVSEDEFTIRPKRTCDLKNRTETEASSNKIQKAIATVTPYSQQSQKGFKSDSLESLCSEERKPNNVLQESGIFEEVETETRGTQTDVNESFECSGELNTEIQRLNSIREKLERQGRNKSLNVNEGEGLECKCVKLGKKHKQYYERRLKFLEGKISIYEAAEDVKKAKLSERLQKEFLLENKIQELESELTELHEKYERLEEECCELEEIENDTRLHWQQLEMDYELCTAQLRDMSEQRDCTRAQVERLMNELTTRENTFQIKEKDSLDRLRQLETFVPVLIAYNVYQAMQVKMGKLAIADSVETVEREQAPHVINSITSGDCSARYNTDVLVYAQSRDKKAEKELEQQLEKLLSEKKIIEKRSIETRKNLESKVANLEKQLQSLKSQAQAAEHNAEKKSVGIDERIIDIEDQMRKGKKLEQLPKEILHTSKSERRLIERIEELEKREVAYLEMLTQADDMWAEMEGGYKQRIEEAMHKESKLKGEVDKLSNERELYRKCIEPLKKKIKEVEDAETALRVALEKADRDASRLSKENQDLETILKKANAESARAQSQLKELQMKFKKETDQLRRLNKQAEEEALSQVEVAKKSELAMSCDLDFLKKELQRTYKHAQELETTNSELKEEVESLEKQLALTQKTLSQCKRRCDEKIKTLSHELSIKTEELEEMRSETMRQSLHTSRIDLKPDRTEYIDEGYSICTAVPKKLDYGRMHHSLGYISTDTRCSCPSMRSHLVGQLIEDLFERIHSTADDDLTRLCKEIVPSSGRVEVTANTKAKITNYLLMAISKELVRSIGDADAKTDTEEWQRTVSSMTYSVPNYSTSDARGEFASLRLEGNAGVLNGASRLASVSCACAAARLCAAVPELADNVKTCQEEVLDHSDVKVMEEQLANAIESIVNCPSCALGTNAIVWSTDV